MNDDSCRESHQIAELGKARSDEYTERILAFLREIEKTCPKPFIQLLADVALARALIVHLVISYGPERGLTEARAAFDSTF
jgi:hypothetical protein